MKISVILAVYNEEKYLQKCLETLATQDYTDFEVLVVDDGSWKEVKASDYKLGKLAGKISFDRLYHGGPALARNFAAEKAKGEILVFLDGDMEFTPNFLSELVAPILDGKAIGTFSTQEYVANWDNVWAKCWNFENGISSNLRVIVKDNMVRDFRAILKSKFDEVEGFDNIGYTDTWSLGQKLKMSPVATAAKYFHYNPSTINEVFMQALWIGGRQRKFGILGKFVAIVRSTFPFSLILGMYKAWKFKQMEFIKFKFVYDLGILGGILDSLVNHHEK